ncbi:MAG: IS200/IS605 family transposase [Thermomicrobiales bacterium]
MSYWRLFYHIVWATRHREQFIDHQIAGLIRGEIDLTCRKYRAIPHAVGFMPDHVHLAISIPPRVAVSDLVGVIKGGTSLQINSSNGPQKLEQFGWQSEFGVHSFSERSLASVFTYVNNQVIHHRDGNLWSEYEIAETTPPNAR